MTVVRTTRGKVRGVVRDGITSFLGVPFAAELTGPGWYSAPMPPEPWSGVRSASEFGPSAPQVRLSPGVDDLLTARVPAEAPRRR